MTISEAHRHAVECGCVVFSVDYRKGPEVQCPRNHLDFVDAIEHIVTNASQYGINRSEICAGGYSGGGWIVMGAMIQYLKLKLPNPIKALFLVTPMVYEILPSMKFDALHEWETYTLLTIKKVRFKRSKKNSPRKIKIRHIRNPIHIIIHP